MSCATPCDTSGTPKDFRLPMNIALPYIYNWNSYDGLPVATTANLTWTSFPAGEPTAFLISAASKEEINNPSPLNGEAVPRPADINGNPVDINIYSSQDTSIPFDVAVSLVPQNTGPTPHVHWSDYEWFYVLAGSITLYVSHADVPDAAIPGVDGTPLADHLYEVNVAAGQMVYGPSNMIHSFTNYSQEPAAWLTIWRRDQTELPGGISQFFTRGDIAPLVLDYDASVDYYLNSDFLTRVTHWAETFPSYNVTISSDFGSYITSGQYDPAHPNQPGPDNPNVIEGAPQDVLDANNAQELNAMFQGFSDLLGTIVREKRTISIESGNHRDSLPINLEISISSMPADVVEFGYYHVDNAKGSINGIPRDDSRYSKQVSKNAITLFGNAGNLASSASLGSATISVETGQTLAFFVRDQRGHLTVSTTTPKAFDFVNHAGSEPLATDKISVNARLKGPIATLADILSGHNDGFRQPLLDSRPLIKREGDLYSESSVSTNVPSGYHIGYYKITDPSGAVLDSSGQSVLPAEPGYAAAALRRQNLATDLNASLAAALKSGVAEPGTFDAGELYAPYVKVQPQGSDRPQPYFAFNKANPDGKSHLISLGTNTFGFRCSARASTYDDVIVANAFRLAPPSTTEPGSVDSEQQIEIQNYGVNRGSLAFYRANKTTGAVDGLLPSDPGYAEAAHQWAKDHDTIVNYRDLPAVHESKVFADLGLNPAKNYGLLYALKPDSSGAIQYLSSYAAANPEHRQYFSAYAAGEGLQAYGLDSQPATTNDYLPTFNDLYITSNIDNITFRS